LLWYWDDEGHRPLAVITVEDKMKSNAKKSSGNANYPGLWMSMFKNVTMEKFHFERQAVYGVLCGK
jgi:hypothetical protein